MEAQKILVLNTHQSNFSFSQYGKTSPAATTAMRVVEEERPLTLPKGPNFARKKKVGKYDFYTYTKNHTYVVYYKAKSICKK